MKSFATGFALLLVGALAGCASATDDAGDVTATTAEDDAITTEEMTEGMGSDGADGVEPGDDESSGIEGSDRFAPFHGPDFAPQIANDGSPIDPAVVEDQMIESCHRVTGYRRGHAFSLCVVNINGKPVEVHTAIAFRRMALAASHRGIHLWIVSGFRTMAQQRALYRAYRNGTGNLAAYPGYSNHQSGHALDLNTHSRGVASWLRVHAHGYGFKRTVPSELWHWEHW